MILCSSMSQCPPGATCPCVIVVLSSSASSCPPGAIMVLCCSTSSWCYVSFWPHTCFSMGSCLHGVGCLHGTITLCSSASRCPSGVTRPYVIMVLSSSMSCCPPGVVMFHVFLVSREFTATCVCFSMLSCLRDIGPLHASRPRVAPCRRGTVTTSQCPPGVTRPRVIMVLCYSTSSRPHACAPPQFRVSMAWDVFMAPCPHVPPHLGILLVSHALVSHWSCVALCGHGRTRVCFSTAPCPRPWTSSWCPHGVSHLCVPPHSCVLMMFHVLVCPHVSSCSSSSRCPLGVGRLHASCPCVPPCLRGVTRPRGHARASPWHCVLLCHMSSCLHPLVLLLVLVLVMS